MKKFAIVGTVVAGIILIFFLYPQNWYAVTRKESVRVLRMAQTPSDLTNAVGSLGLFIPLTNKGWIAIRYDDSHAGSIRSCAVARDSGGEWFESERHFCGSLRGWPELKEEVAAEEEQRRLAPESMTNRVSRVEMDNGMFPSYREMKAIESAPNLQSARRALQAIGFRALAE